MWQSYKAKVEVPCEIALCTERGQGVHHLTLNANAKHSFHLSVQNTTAYMKGFLHLMYVLFLFLNILSVCFFPREDSSMNIHVCLVEMLLKVYLPCLCELCVTDLQRTNNEHLLFFF